MKLVSEYLERCQKFQQLADGERNPDARQRMREQADAYYKLAAKRARELSQPIPPKPRATA
jgi:hypothetical protein